MVSVYSCTASLVVPVTNIFVPSLLNWTLIGFVSLLLTLKLSTKEAVDTSKAVESEYSFISSPETPQTNIFVPSWLKVRPLGFSSWELTSNGLESCVVEATLFELAPSLTDSVASSLTVPVSLAATGALFDASPATITLI